MDLHVERQCVDDMKAGNEKQFLLLFDANFETVFKYVTRRVFDKNEAEKIVRLTFLDALGQIQSTPTDVSYLVWLYSLARPRVWAHIDRSSFPQKQGLIAAAEKEKKGDDKEGDLVDRANKMIGKLSLEEREILRLKFFEEVADGDVMVVLGVEEGTIGSKIYRVLKRAYFLLFGESDGAQGVYFGELSGFFERMREREEIVVPDVFKLSLKVDLTNRIEKKDFAIDAEAVEEKPQKPKEPPVGSKDPAKIFVEAVAEMKEEEAIERAKVTAKYERRERFYNFVDRWKPVFALGAAVVVLLFVTWIFFGVLNFEFKVDRGYPNECSIEVVFEGDFSDAGIRSVNTGISDRLCGHFEVERLKVSRLGDSEIDVEVDIPGWFLEYKFVKKVEDWRIKKYARTIDSDEQSGQV